MSEKANDLLNKFGSAQFDFMVWNTPDNLVARDKARQEISDYIAELEAEKRWTPVSERLPEVDQDVLVFDQRGDITIDYLVALNREGVAYYTNSDDGAVCWMPLPEPPEDK